MQRRHFLGSALLLAAAHPRLARAAAEPPASYAPGETLDPETFVLDADGTRVRVADRAEPTTRLLYLLIVGGANGPGNDRGPRVWCPDSAREVELHATLIERYRERGLTPLVVAVPPVYSGARRTGYPAGVFLDLADTAPEHREAVAAFVERSEALRRAGALPFAALFYDPRFRLLDDPDKGPHAPAYGPVPAWQGRLRPRDETQTYGTPVVWLLDRELRVLHEPFHGNVYERPPLRYTEADLRAAIEALLGSA
jgi:hypothetical protein